MDAFIQQGNVQPLREALGKSGRRGLGSLALLYAAARKSPGLQTIIAREMNRTALQPGHAEGRFRDVLAVHHFLTHFLAERLRALPNPDPCREHPARARLLSESEATRRWDSWIWAWPREPKRVFAELDVYVRSLVDAPAE